VVHAIVGRALLKDDPEFALSILLGFYGMMRAGELLNVRPRDVAVSEPTSPAVLSLGLTKSGKRQGAAESIAVSVFDVVRCLYQWKNLSHKALVQSSSQWRTKFSETLTELGLQSFEFRPYSLRRGGATLWFTKHGSFDRLLIQGRWNAPKTARIFINSGLATLAEMKIPQHPLRGFISVYRKSLEKGLPSLERTHKVGGSGGRGKGHKKAVKSKKNVFPSGRGPGAKVLETLTHTGLAVCSQGGARLVSSLVWQGNTRGFWKESILREQVSFLSFVLF
jgi:hypothetical protein